MEDLNKFKNEMNLSGKNVYVGHRYVPKIMGEWDNTQIYEPLSIVQYQGASYTSRQFVPVGAELTNEDYWAVTGNYNAQVEQYRQDVNLLSGDLDLLTNKHNGIDTWVGSREINPENYEGATDREKLQNALDDVIENPYTIRLTKIYDLTGEPPLIIRKTSIWNRRPIQFIGGGGGFIKNDEGLMFTAEKDNTGDVSFLSVRFESTEGVGTKVFDSDKLIRYQTMFCNFIGVDTVDYNTATKGYVQSIRHIGDTITGGLGSAIIVYGARDVSIDNCTVEHRENFFEQKYDVTIPYPSIGNLRLRDNVIEGLSGFNIKLSNVDSLVIDGDYNESNEQGNIIFENPTEGLNAQLNGVTISNIRYLASDPLIPMVKFAGNLSNVLTFGNHSHGAPLFDFSGISTINAIRSFNDNSLFDNIYGANGKRNIVDDVTPYIRIRNFELTALQRRRIDVTFDRPINIYDSINVIQQNENLYPVTIYPAVRNHTDPTKATIWVENPRDTAVTINDIYVNLNANYKGKSITQ